MQRMDPNLPLSQLSMRMISMYLSFPEGKPITAIDYRAREGQMLYELTKSHDTNHLFAVEQNRVFAENMRKSGMFERVANSYYRTDSRVSQNAFSLAIIDPIISRVVENELLNSVDAFVEPDFEKEEKERAERQREFEEENLIDFSKEELTEEEKEKQKEEAEKRLEKSIEERRLAYRRALREQEKRISLDRTDNYLLARATERLVPGGILVMVVPKEMIDTAITFRLTSNYEDIKILRLEEDEYMEKRKCIILAKKRMHKVPINRTEGYLLAETKLKPHAELEEISFQTEPTYSVPSSNPELVEQFRIGPLTGSEVMDSLKKSSLLENYQESYSQVLTDNEPVAPTPLHKGHIMLLLTSGYLNGYIGRGVNQHLVKGTSIKRVRETNEVDENGDTTTSEREYYDISVKYLDSNGDFRSLM